MWIIFYIIGIPSILGGIVWPILPANGLSETWERICGGSAAVLGGVLLVVAANQRYRGHWAFVVGLGLIFFAATGFGVEIDAALAQRSDDAFQGIILASLFLMSGLLLLWSGQRLHRYYCNRGQAKYCLRMVPEALADYNKAIELDPGNAQAYYNRGTLMFISLTNYTGALANFSKAIELHSDPQEYDIYFWRGNARAELGDYAGAIADFSKSLELNPKSDQAQYATINLSKVRKLLSESEHK